MLTQLALLATKRAIRTTADETQTLKMDDIDIDVSNAPWINPTNVSVKLNDIAHRHGLGISYIQCHKMHRPFVAQIHQTFKGMQLRAARRKYLKSYIIAINDQPVFNTADVDKLVAFYQNYDDPP